MMAASPNTSQEGAGFARSADPEAFAAFYREHEDAILVYFLRRTGANSEAAADLTAETFAQALRTRRKYDATAGTPGAWLFGIAHHVLARSMRRGRVEDRARRKLRMEPLLLDDEAMARIDELSEGAVALQALDGLPRPQRDAVRSRIIDEVSYEEIAKRLRCSEAVVRQRVSRGLSALRTHMEELS